jgi:hypothetical protein
VAGKFLALGDEKFVLRGVTYGTFRTGPDGCDYPEPEVVAGDFAAMAARGFNTVRVYTVPPRWLLDAALDHGLRVMVGLPWEQHVAYLEAPGLADDIERRVREGVRACAGHRRCSATRWATRSRRRWCAGAGGARPSASSSGCTAPARPRTRTRWSRT